jgi:hypothetical protein
MLKEMKKTTLAIAVAGLAAGVSTGASAFVAAGSSLDVTNLIITSDAIGGNYTFTLQNIATLNGAAAPVGFATCNAATPCPLGPITLAAPSASLGPAPTGFALSGPSPTGEWSFADSQINTAEGAGNASTSTQQRAESVLQTGTDASAGAQIQSITTLVFNFALGTGDSLSLGFDAAANMYAQVSELLAGLYNAQSNLNASFTLSLDNGDGSINWNPQGTFGAPGTNNCSVIGTDFAGVTCVESADSFDLNQNRGQSIDGLNPFSASGSFGIDIANLVEGTYTLTLNAVTSDQLSRTQFTPEPGSILLVGASLAALGVVSRRRKVIS